MSKKLVILGQEILPGDSKVLKMDIARLYTGSKLEVPIIINRAKKDGPCLLISAGIHGDEINGVEIVRQLVSNKYHLPDYGTIICVPVVNTFGFVNMKRAFPDGRDLNRMFPGSKSGPLASRFAHKFMTEVAVHADYGIDFHTGGAMRFNYAHIRISKNDPETLELAQAFGAKFTMYSAQKEKSFRHAMSNTGKKVLLFEGGKSLSLDRNVTRDGVNGALRVMKHLGMNDHSDVLKSEPANEPIIIEKSVWLRAEKSGMYRSWVRVGEHVEKGAIIGSISDPFGFEEKKIKSKFSGYIINNNHLPMVNQGDAIINIAII